MIQFEGFLCKLKTRKENFDHCVRPLPFTPNQVLTQWACRRTIKVFRRHKVTCIMYIPDKCQSFFNYFVLLTMVFRQSHSQNNPALF
ncbi:hypothetical protein OIU74_023672 [Salix koriyanagi]|uniref:Uncharacterized protein n=1 Tax=Salix koriyanagi TaxID=2511006 RepID=A0A9Q0WEA4_9ROSI|nr:hypothetical protein OIU74_023672 [Salix koriyanagi]